MDVTLNGARIHYERAGAGLPLVLLHAGVADSRMWEPQVAAFAKEFEVVRPDMRGFGHSELPPGAWSPVEDLLALVDELQLKPIDLVGCSIGGRIAVDFALEHPERVSRLVLVGPGVSGSTLGERYPEVFEEVNAAEQAKDMVALNEAEMRLWLDGPRRPAGYVKDRRLRELFLDMNGRTMANDWDAAPMRAIDPPAIGRLHEINAPTLVVVGDQDVPSILDTVDLLVKSMPHVRRAEIHDAAHLPNLEHPDEFNRLVLEFLLP